MHKKHYYYYYILEIPKHHHCRSIKYFYCFPFQIAGHTQTVNLNCDVFVHSDFLIEPPLQTFYLVMGDWSQYEGEGTSWLSLLCHEKLCCPSVVMLYGLWRGMEKQWGGDSGFVFFVIMQWWMSCMMHSKWSASSSPLFPGVEMYCIVIQRNTFFWRKSWEISLTFLYSPAWKRPKLHTCLPLGSPHIVPCPSLDQRISEKVDCCAHGYVYTEKKYSNSWTHN